CRTAKTGPVGPGAALDDPPSVPEHRGGPLEYVPDRIEHAVWTRALWISGDGGRAVDVARRAVRPAWIPRVSPWEDPSVIAACRLFPFGFPRGPPAWSTPAAIRFRLA